MNGRTEIINYLINKHHYTSYLEIGIRNPNDNFDHIMVTQKAGVDPNVKCTYQMTSDEYFTNHADIYDIVFIDGLHLADQAWRDINNALRCVRTGWTIVVHDCNPIKMEHQSETYNGGLWNGTVWKSFVKLRSTRPDLWMCVINVDHGVGIVMAGTQPTISIPNPLTFEWLEYHRTMALNLMTFEEFRMII